jgi:hypothetical protein
MSAIIDKFLRILQKQTAPLFTRFDKEYLSPHVPSPKIAGHQSWWDFLYEIGNKPGLQILEVGSREVTGESDARMKLANATYTGFDFYPGKNVDVVGDAHKLSSYFDKDKRFDIIYSTACFEHFAMPWVVATEIAKLLKVGGFVIVETHFSFMAHERPWNFFQFSDLGLKVLFSAALGFECIDSGMSNSIVGRFSSLAAPYLRNRAVQGLYCHSEFIGKKVKDVEGFNWSNVNVGELVNNTKYPEPK